MPALLFPLGLAALLAVVVPLVIHLMRRDELRPVAFAALRWLDPRPKPRQRIRFSEWPLLLVRLLLIAVLAVLLARPVLTAQMSERPFIAVTPRLDLATVRKGDDEVQLHWLAPGFPSTDRPAPQTTASFSSLLRELDAQLPVGVKLTVVVPQTLQGVDAERPVLSRTVDWRIVAGAMPAPQGVAVKMPALSVRHTPERAADVRWFRAVSAAWQTPFEVAATDATLPPTDRVLVWLGAGDIPQNVRDWAKSGGTVLLGSQMVLPTSPSRRIAWRDETGATLMEAQSDGKGRILRFTRPLTPAAFPALIESQFPEELNNVLSAQAVPSRVASRDLIPVTGRSVFTRPAEELTPWLALLAAALFLIERVLATAARRRAAP